jgi:hypothetical protein
MDTEYIRDDQRVVFKISHVFDQKYQRHVVEVRSQLLADSYPVATPRPDYSDHRERWFPSILVYDSFDYKGLIASFDQPEHWTLRDLLFGVPDQPRLVDALEVALDEALGRPSHFAQLAEAHFAPPSSSAKEP